MELCVTVTSH